MAAAIDVEQLRTFLTIAETGSFGRAAQVVEKTQAALSRQMRLLEDRIGRPVFDRDHSGSRLTEAGSRLVGFARRMVDLSEETASVFDQASPRTLAFAMPDDYLKQYLAPIMRRFRVTTSDIEVSLQTSISANIVQMAWAGEIDLGLVTNHCPISVETVHREPLVWVAAETYALDGTEVLPLALAGPDCPWRRIALEALGAAGRESRIVLVSTNWRAIAAAVTSGLALTVLSRATVESGMRIVGEQEGLPSLPTNELGVVRAWNKPASSPARLMAGAIRTVLRGNAGGRTEAMLHANGPTI